MSTVSIERIESGPAWADRASEKFEGYDSAAEETALRAYFARQVEVADANAVCPWAKFVYDDEARKALGLSWTDKNLPKRAQTMTEVMTAALDYDDGPTMVEVMQLVLNATTSSDADLAVLAGDLVDRMARAYAYLKT